MRHIIKTFIILIPLLSACAAPKIQNNNVSRETTVPPAASPAISTSVSTSIDAVKFSIEERLDEAFTKTNDNPTNALKLYESIILSEPKRWEAYYNAGLIHLKLNELKEANAKFIEALKYKAPTDDIYNAIGITHLLIGEKTEAVSFFKKGLKSEKSLYYLINVANVYQAMGEYQEALKYYHQAELAAPLNPELNYNMGLLLYKMDNYEGAIERLDKVSVTGIQDANLLILKAQTLFMLGKYEFSLKIFQEAVSKYPNDPRPYKDMGIIYEIYLEDFEKAIENYTSYIINDGKEAKDVETWRDMAIARLFSGKGKEE